VWEPRVKEPTRGIAQSLAALGTVLAARLGSTGPDLGPSTANPSDIAETKTSVIEQRSACKPINLSDCSAPGGAARTTTTRFARAAAQLGLFATFSS
jgi:hypothetical protein